MWKCIRRNRKMGEIVRNESWNGEEIYVKNKWNMCGKYDREMK